MDNKKIIIAAFTFIVILLAFLFIMEKISLRGIDVNSNIGAESIDLSDREEIKEKNPGSKNSLDTILKSE